MVVNKLAVYYSIKLKENNELYKCGKGKIFGEEVVLAQPLTYMNNSGVAVKELLRRQKSSPSDLVIIYDDVDIEIGRLKIKERGGSGGHKGCASIINTIGTENFTRVRIGIGHPPEGMDVVEYVLSDFKPSEQPVIEEIIEDASDAVKMIINDDIAGAMNKYNQT